MSGKRFLIVAAVLVVCLAVPGGRFGADELPNLPFPRGGDDAAGDFPWRLGNCNKDQLVDINDVVFALGYLFSSRALEPCLPLCDVDGDGRLTLSDPLLLFEFAFQGVDLDRLPPSQEELCDRMDNDCDGLVDEACTPGDAEVLLVWDPAPEPAEDQAPPRGRRRRTGYRVHLGTESGRYTEVRDAGASTVYAIRGLFANVTYYFAVSAYDQEGNASGLSAEVSARIGEAR